MKLWPIKSPEHQAPYLAHCCLISIQVLVLCGVGGCSGDDGPAKALDPLADVSPSDDDTTTRGSSNTTAPSNTANQRSTAPEETSASPDETPTNDPTSGAKTDTGNTGATSDASDSNQTQSEPPPPQTRRFEGLPIPIAFVGMTDTPSGVTQFAAAAEFADCPSGTALGWDQQMMTGPLWSDCAATHMTERINHAFQTLLNTDQVLFESLGYSTFESPEYSVFTSRNQVDAALQALDATEFNTPGQITAIVSNWTHSIGGLAPYDQPLDDENGIVLAISQVSDDAVIHEVGHALGFKHTDEDADHTGVITYDFCEPLSAPVLPKCNCEMNLMEAVSGVCTAQCGEKAYTFDTPTHGQYFRDVATCWLSERRFAGNPIECEWPDVAHCVGYENTGMTCACLNGVGSMEMDSCADATDAEITALLETCDAELSNDNLCTSFVAYPGMYCFEHNGEYDCACLNDDTPFPTGKPCAQFTPEEIYSTCLGSQPENTCHTTAGGITLSCVESDTALNCICSNTGSTLDSDNTTCAGANLTDWITSCPEN